MKPFTTGIAAALISGVVMFTAGAKAAEFDSFTNTGALIQGADAQSTTSATALRPVATGPATAPISNQNAPRRRTVNRTTTAARQDRDTRIEEIRREDDRSWGKSAMVIGG